VSAGAPVDPASDPSGNAVQAENYDLRGLKCPLPVLKTAKRMSTMAVGSRLWVETTDPMAMIDMTHYCAENRHRLVATEAVEGGHRFLIEKGAG
jgi:tRNA 2-thiouridine synthesizing protein A